MSRYCVMKKNRTAYLVCLTLAASFCCCGCGLIARLLTPTGREKKVPAEFELSGKKYKNKKILVLVQQPAWLSSRVNLRSRLTKPLNRELADKLKIDSDLLVCYDELSDFRSSRADFSSLSPVRVASGLNAATVLLIFIDNYKLDPIEATGYFEGFLGVQAELYDVAGDQRLWPKGSGGRRVQVGFEIGPKGTSAAVSRLANSMAHCIVRYLYNCPVDQFRIFDDRTGAVSQKW